MAFMDFTRTALKNLFSKPATRQYPQELLEYRHAAAAMWKLIWTPAFSAACAAASALRRHYREPGCRYLEH